MTKTRETGSARRYFSAGRRLNYDGIKLVPVATDWYPFNQPQYADKWHVPGRVIMSTSELVSLATSRGIVVTLTEYEGVATHTTRLN